MTTRNKSPLEQAAEAVLDAFEQWQHENTEETRRRLVAVGLELKRQQIPLVSRKRAASMTRRFKAARNRACRWQGNPNAIPYGYILDADGRLAVCESETRIMRIVDIRAREGVSQKAIAVELAAAGFTSRAGRLITPQNVANILIALQRRGR
jgi:P2-related tail formation protein